MQDLTGRTRAVILFNFGPPVGYGLAYLIETIAKDIWPNDWRYTLRITPFILCLTLILIVVAYVEPERFKFKSPDQQIENKGFIKDLKILIQNKTYILLICCWTLGLASLGAFSWWSSSMIDYSLRNKRLSPSSIDNFKKSYSLAQVLGGLVGLLLPVKISSYFKTKKSVFNIDCFLLATSFFSAGFSIYVYLATIEINAYLSFVAYTMIIFSYNMCWITQSYIFLDIIQPRLRSTANGLIICVLHLVGDSISPYWVGSIADYCMAHEFNKSNTIFDLMRCTQLSLYPIVFVSFFGGVFGLFMTLTFEKDRRKSS